MNALPEENHIYLILLSRIQDEEDLQGTAREWIREAEKKLAGLYGLTAEMNAILRCSKISAEELQKLPDEQANDIIEKRTTEIFVYPAVSGKGRQCAKGRYENHCV